MVIRKIETYNYRIFYKNNVFELFDGLNLILGWHGDGKTTIFDALEWLFCTDGTNKMNIKFISKKRIEELFPNESDDVRVAMTYEHKGMTKTLEKKFHFTKSFDGEVSTSNYSFLLIEDNGSERVINEGFAFDKDLSPEMRKFMMFGGECDLCVMQNSNSLKYLIDQFCAVHDFDAYFGFMEYATRHSEKARDNAQKRDKKNTDRIKQLHQTIKQEQTSLAEIEREISIKENEAVNFDNLLKNIDQSKEASKLLVSVNKRIEHLYQKKSETAARIREDYNRNLLEDMWVLLGFENIVKEYSTKVYKAESRRISKSDFKHDYIGELEKLDVVLYNNYSVIADIRHKIQETVNLNNRLHDDVKKIEANLESEIMQKKRILVQSDDLTEEQLMANYDKISIWMDKKNQAENRIDTLKRQRELHRAKLEEAQMALSKMSEGTTSAIYAKTALIIRQISEAFKNAKEKNKRALLNTIEDEANLFLGKLASNDFTGTIRIMEMQNGQCESFLTDGDGIRIFNPGSTLKLAYLMSLLLAIGKMMCANKENEMPLIYDGSVSRFDIATGNSLLDCSTRQMIVLTRDYLMFDRDSNKFVNLEKIKKHSCTVYQLEKKRPFDSRRLGTMQTVVKRLQ